MKTAAIRLFTGDETERPLKERKESVKKTTGIQKAAKPKVSKETPARCAPIAPKRLCALSRGPVEFQNSLSAGQKDKRLTAKITAINKRSIPGISLLTG